jgi:SAM-dependent methyltransferase
MLSRLRELMRQRRNRETLYSTAAYWDYKAKSHEGKAASMWRNNALNHLYERELHAEVQRCLGNVHGLKVLDVGCGTGRSSRWFAMMGAHTTGIDFSEGALAIAKSQSTGVNPTYRLESVFELADDNTYDVAFTWGVLAMACVDRDQLLDALVRIRKALRENGYLLLNEHIHRGFLHRVLDMDLHTFNAVVREAGFQIRVTQSLHFWPMRLLLAYIPWPMWITAPLYEIGQAAMKLPGLCRLGDYHAILACPAEHSNAMLSNVTGFG